MSLQKFEQRIKMQLESRKIQPQEETWKTLESYLNKSKRINSKLQYLAVAATFVVVLGLVWFVSQDTQLVPAVGIDAAFDSTPVNEGKIDLKNVVASIDSKGLDNIVPNKEEMNIVKSSLFVDNTIKTNDVEEPLAKVILNEDIFKKDSKIILVNETTIETISIPILFQNQTTEAELVSPEISDDDLDALLNPYRDKIRNQNQDRLAVADRAARLLKEAEFENNQSFRKQIIDGFVTGIKSVHTAYVNRKN